MYDIEEAFAAIEEELISSMIRNFDRHRAWEEEEEMEWEQWQALQLRSLEQYKKRNKKRFTKQFDKINKQIEMAIREARDRGGFEQELKILEAIKKGKFTPSRKKGANAEFFKLNDRKIDALVKATVNDMQKAETAILRMANDKYRQVIFNAQVYASSGAGTYEKAVDMATRDFLSSGLNCVEYKNGARHTLRDYADMALRTASKRAYLTGEGEKRVEWGIHTVIINKRGNPCPKCLPFVGRVFIDDVWSGGSSKDGKYPLLSSAVEAGLYHPRCKDSHTTFFPEDDLKPVSYSKNELRKIEDDYIGEQEQKRAANNAKKYNRLAEYSLDPENKSVYKAKSTAWEKASEITEKVVEEVKEPAFIPVNTIKEAEEYAKQFIDEGYSKKFNNEAKYSGISLDNANQINKALRDLYASVEMPKINGIKTISATSAKGKKVFSSADAVASYDPVEHGIFLNKDILKNATTVESYNLKAQEAWKLVMSNIDNLTGNQKELALTYKKAGKALVGDGSVYDYIVHEMGHHVQWEVLDVKTNNMMGENMKKYAPRISGYANASKGEYIAESFAAYIKGENKILDPEFVDYMNKLKVVENSAKSSTMMSRNLVGRKMANGLRESPSHILSEAEIKSIVNDAESLDIPIDVLRFNKGNQTGFLDRTRLINIKGDILPDLSSTIPRDCMSQRAVLAHEYYGHFKSHPSRFVVGDWRDEFMASYRAALETPNLSDDERRMLMLDAYDRAKDAGVSVKYNKEARRIIYGYDD